MGVAVAVWLLALSVGCRAPQEPRLANLSGDAERGRQLMAVYGCGSCHTIPNVPGANTVVGPPLWGMADRGYIGGVLPNTEAAMIRWLMNPQTVATRTAMPNLYVTEEDATHMTAYLQTLRAEPVLVRMVRGYIERATGRPGSAPLRSPDGLTTGTD
ncbi:MAG: c-type cytochrome [Acidobacteria bacterium]|nr:c-type cytochrome [Acidobacteriota bacterium]